MIVCLFENCRRGGWAGRLVSVKSRLLVGFYTDGKAFLHLVGAYNSQKRVDSRISNRLHLFFRGNPGRNPKLSLDDKSEGLCTRQHRKQARPRVETGSACSTVT